MDYINYFNSLSSSQDRLDEKTRVHFNELLAEQGERLKNADIQTLKTLLTAFPKVYWDSDMLTSDKPLHEFLFNLEKDKQITLIPELIRQSKSYPQYVFWAKEMLDKLSDMEQQQIELPDLLWSSDADYTLISAEEIAYRKRQNFKCLDEYSRPCRLADLECYDIWLNMISKTNSSCLFFNG